MGTARNHIRKHEVIYGIFAVNITAIVDVFLKYVSTDIERVFVFALNSEHVLSMTLLYKSQTKQLRCLYTVLNEG